MYVYVSALQSRIWLPLGSVCCVCACSCVNPAHSTHQWLCGVCCCYENVHIQYELSSVSNVAPFHASKIHPYLFAALFLSAQLCF